MQRSAFWLSFVHGSVLDERSSVTRGGFIGLGLAIAIGGGTVYVAKLRPSPPPAARRPPPLAPLPASTARERTPLWDCQSGGVFPPARQPPRQSGCYRSDPSLGPGSQWIGGAWVGAHRCQLGELTECPSWIAWNVCRYPKRGDIRFDGDGYVVGMRVHRESRGTLPVRRSREYVHLDGLRLRLGTPELEYVQSKGLGVTEVRSVVDAEFGVIEIVRGEFFELEFDTVGAEKVLGAIQLIR